MTPPPDGRADNHRLVCALLITLAVAAAAGRIASAERVNEPSVHRRDDDKVTPRPTWPKQRPEPSPTFGSNDRSRFAAVRALVDHGEWVIGRRDPSQAGLKNAYGDHGITFDDPNWGTVDKVMNPDTREFYSSKPPLLSVVAAGEYWLLKRLFGWSIVEQRGEVVRVIVATFNLVPLVVYLLALAALTRRLGGSDATVYFVVAAGGFATLVTPFLVTFNNHTPAAAAAVIAVWATVKIIDGGGAWLYAIAGLAAGLTASLEMPALALAAGLGVYLLTRSPARTLALFLPLMLLPIAAQFGLNYLQIGEWEPVYAKFGGPWYEYQGSHWLKRHDPAARGIDFAAEPKHVYAFHLLLGHHGWFALTPIMFLGLVGMATALLRPAPSWRGSGDGTDLRRLVALFTLLVSAVVIAFYIYKSNNYGGWSHGPRWLMWLTPLWLLAMVPPVNALLRSRIGTALALLLLALSVVSVHHQSWNPWRHPWLYNWMEARGWIDY